MPRRLLRHTLTLAALASSCSTSPSPDANTSDAALDATVDAGGSDGSLDAVEVSSVCTSGDDARAPGVTCLREVRGIVVDESGAPVPDLPITVCGTDCFFGRTDANGAFVVTPGMLIDITHYAIEVHGRPDHVSLLVPVPDPIDGVVALARPLVAPRYTDVGGLVPDPASGGTVTAGEVSVTFPAGTMLQPNVEDGDLGDLGRTFRTVAVSPVQSPPFAQGLTSVYSLAPFDLISSAPVGITVVNHTGFAPGAAVDFVVMGDEVFLEPVTGGRAVVAAHGHVSSDGRTVSTDPGEGVSYLTWFGLRLSGG